MTPDQLRATLRAVLAAKDAQKAHNRYCASGYRSDSEFLDSFNRADKAIAAADALLEEFRRDDAASEGDKGE